MNGIRRGFSCYAFTEVCLHISLVQLYELQYKSFLAIIHFKIETLIIKLIKVADDSWLYLLYKYIVYILSGSE